MDHVLHCTKFIFYSNLYLHSRQCWIRHNEWMLVQLQVYKDEWTCHFPASKVTVSQRAVVVESGPNLGGLNVEAMQLQPRFDLHCLLGCNYHANNNNEPLKHECISFKSLSKWIWMPCICRCQYNYHLCGNDWAGINMKWMICWWWS